MTAEELSAASASAATADERTEEASPAGNGVAGGGDAGDRDPDEQPAPDAEVFCVDSGGVGDGAAEEQPAAGAEAVESREVSGARDMADDGGGEKRLAADSEADGSREVKRSRSMPGTVADSAEASPRDDRAKVELEVDASDDARPRINPASVKVNSADATLNVMLAAEGNLLMTLTEGGCQYLLAGARTTAGVKAGRYMFEMRIVECLSPEEPTGSQGRTPAPRQVVRVGVSLSGSSPLLSDTTSAICFDSEGFFIHGRSRTKVSQKFGRGHVIGVLLNLDPSGANASTISLFRDGERVSDPQAIPEGLRGKPLYPTVTYRNVTLNLHFGPPRRALPFRCRPLADAAADDIELAPAAPCSPDGRCEVVFPVGLPEQGFFDWVDAFLEKHPSYVELSDRRISDWASKSGIFRPKARKDASSDKPDVAFGIPLMDDFSVQQVLALVAPTLRRNYVVPELVANLVESERQEQLRRFSAAEFRRKAVVVMGEPSDEYKARVRSLILAEKEARANLERSKRAQEDERKRLLSERKQKAEEMRKLRDGAQKRRDDEKKSEDQSDMALEVKEDEEKESAEEQVPAPKVELTEEELALSYRKTSVPDVTESALGQSFAKFSVPSAHEGFDEVAFEWQSEPKCRELMQEWLQHMKLTQRVEDLQPGAAFKEQLSLWTKALQDFRRRQSEWKDPVRRKDLLARLAAAAPKGDAVEGSDGKAEVKVAEIDMEELDVYAVEDVMDVGNGQPLFGNFEYEDWTLLAIRVEIHLLLHGFRRDLNDPDRPSFAEGHFNFYYRKYFRKEFNLKNYNVEGLSQFVELLSETFAVNEKGLVQALLAEDTPHAHFVKVTEFHRRDRLRRLEAGDEAAKLEFKRQIPAPPQVLSTAQHPQRAAMQTSKEGRDGRDGRGDSHGESRGSSYDRRGSSDRGGSSYDRRGGDHYSSRGANTSSAPRTGSGGGAYDRSTFVDAPRGSGDSRRGSGGSRFPPTASAGHKRPYSASTAAYDPPPSRSRTSARDGYGTSGASSGGYYARR